MGNEDRANGSRSDALLFHRDKRGSPAVQEETRSGAINEDTSLKPSPAPKSVATAQKCYGHISHRILSQPFIAWPNQGPLAFSASPSGGGPAHGVGEPRLRFVVLIRCLLRQ